MTWPTALPVAAPRVPRTAVGRRALQLALLVAGLFALGFLCGEQAHAADSVPTPAPTPTAVTARVESQTVESLTSAATPAAVPASAPVHEAGEAGEVVAAVSEELGRTSAQEPPVSSSPALPSLPALPLVSDLPELPGLPALPGLPSLPGRTLPAPVGQAPAQGSAVSPAPVGHAPGDQETAAGTAPHGPVGSGTDGSNGVGHRVAPARTGHGSVPAPHGPAGDRNGGASSRHGDAHAVTPYHRVPLRLVPGSAVRSDAAGTQDRYRDVPVFPG